ncbi:hypothetical protein BZG36_01958 [Bifiguratus adelaidae]|uniref:Helicase ATP-binding domain-containing protein n=1 Tax=Bifiguratus adelaidae TaxID=1938954 RepID=A0A261Y3U9_9FUNG|nr:hypothetical protein BZG36_01958 [Bifiguratus adelaidae]
MKRRSSDAASHRGPMSRPDETSSESSIDEVVFSLTDMKDLQQRIEASNQSDLQASLRPSAANVKYGGSGVGQHLPIYAYKDEIVQLIRRNRVTIISAGTGCGKSTQVPQYIMYGHLSRGEAVNIVCTQPRRLAATSIAHRVAHECNETLGQLVGFQIGGRQGYGQRTRLKFVTSAILLAILQEDRYLQKLTHVVMDEIHERNIDDDLLLAHMHTVLSVNTKLKLIIMSATLDTQRFREYFRPFANADSEVPVVGISLQMYPIQVHYIDHVLENLPNGLRGSGRVHQDLTRAGFSNATRDALLGWITQLHFTLPATDSFLVFVPGIALMLELEDEILFHFHQHSTDIEDVPNVLIVKLHSSTAIDEQCHVLKPSPPKARKIILATNIAESSVTVPGVSYIFDTCLRKDVFYDPENRCYSLNDAWISLDCAKQRMGRTGRVAPGTVYRFVQEDFFQKLPSERMPEVQRTPLTQLILRTVDAHLGDPSELLRRCLDPPLDQAITFAINELVSFGCVKREHALFFDEDKWSTRSASAELLVTPLGAFLSKLPLDLSAGLLVAYGIIFGQVHECIVLAALLQRKSVILQPQGMDLASAAALKRFHSDIPAAEPLKGGSDLISQLRAYLYWEEKTKDGSIPANLQPQWCQDEFLSLYWLREVKDITAMIYQALSRLSYTPEVRSDQDENVDSENTTNAAITSDGNDADDPRLPNAIRVLDEAMKGESLTINVDRAGRRGINPRFMQNDVRALLSHLKAPAATNPFMNVFDRAYAISTRPVTLRKEPDILLVCILIIAVSHPSMLRLLPPETGGFPDFPPEFDSRKTIGLVADRLPPNEVLINELQKDTGLIARFCDLRNESANGSQGDRAYVEYFVPHLPTWTHSIIDIPDEEEQIPDALYLLSKYRTSRHSTWMQTQAKAANNPRPASQNQLKFSSVQVNPNLSTRLSVLFANNSASTHLVKSSLFYPLLCPHQFLDYYALTAARLTAVANGAAYVAEHITCLFHRHIPSEGGELMNPGDLLLCLFAVDLDTQGSWKATVNSVSYPIFYQLPSKEVCLVIKSFRSYLAKRWSKKWLQMSSNPGVRHNKPPKDLLGIAKAWTAPHIPSNQAGHLLKQTVTVLLNEIRR